MSDPTNPKDAFGDLKPQLWLVPAVANIREAKVFELGAKKYGPYNWRDKPVRTTVYIAAALRHLFAMLDGEWLDQDPQGTKQPHAAHVRACMGILLDADSLGQRVDDLPPKGKAGELIAQLAIDPQNLDNE